MRHYYNVVVALFSVLLVILASILAWFTLESLPPAFHLFF